MSKKQGPKVAKEQPRVEEEEEDNEDEMGGGIDAEMLRRFTDPNYSTTFIAGLPEKVRGRVRGLQALQKQYNDLYAAYTKELALLDKKYEAEYKPLLDYRRDVIRGAKEPTSDEIQRGFPEEHKGHVSLDEGERTDVKGIPAFWLRALKNDRRLRDLITERDEACLAHLVDIQCNLMENPNDGFTLVFIFNENEFFEETVLSKNYKLQEDDGELVLEKATGSTITWKKDKNLTVEQRRKKQRSKKTKEVRYVTTFEKCDSFFNFFSPPQPDDEEKDGEEEEEDYDVADRVEEDYEAGLSIKDRIIMRAVEYFTGEADSGSDEDEDYDEEEEEEEEEEEAPPARGAGRGRGGQPQGGRGGGGAKGGQQQDCKQQ
jgi:nucleosome assembly protein 1-like 1